MTNKPELKKMKEIGDSAILDFFSYTDLLSIQEHFCDSTGLSSIIVSITGEPLVEPAKQKLPPWQLGRTNDGACIPIPSHRYFTKLDTEIISCTVSGVYYAVAPIGPEGEVLALWAIGFTDLPNSTHNEKKTIENQETPSITKEQFIKIALLHRDMAKQLCANATRKREFELLKQDFEEYTHELSESAEKYRFLIENQNDIVIKFDSTERFTYVSPGFCRVFGKNEDQLLGQSVFSIVHPDDIEPSRQILE